MPNGINRIRAAFVKAAELEARRKKIYGRYSQVTTNLTVVIAGETLESNDPAFLAARYALTKSLNETLNEIDHQIDAIDAEFDNTKQPGK